ncbi:MAG: hypothetical protein ACYDBB_27245 [Armatimonadota bacterium]
MFCIGACWAQDVTSPDVAAAPRVIAPDILRFGTVDVIPVPPVLTVFGITQQYKGGQFTLVRNERSFRYASASKTAWQNGRRVTLPLAPFTRHEVQFVPVRPLIESLGGKYETDDTGRKGMITFTDARPVSMRVVTITEQVKTYQDKEDQLYCVPLDGSASRRISYFASSCSNPQLANDGTLFFQLWSRRGWKGAVCRVASDTHSLQPLFVDQQDTPVWMYILRPDAAYLLIKTIGTRIGGAEPPSYLVNADGKLLHRFDPFVTECGFAGSAYLLLKQTGEPSLLRYDLANGTTSQVVKGHTASSSADGAYIAYVDIDKEATICLADATGKTLDTVGKGTDPHWSPDNQWLLYKRYDTERVSLCIAQITDGKISARRETSLDIPKLAIIWNTHFSADSAHILFTVEPVGNLPADAPHMAHQGLWLMNHDAGELQQVAQGTVKHAGFTPNHRGIVYTLEDKKGVNNLWITDLLGRQRGQLTHGMNIRDLCLSPAGNVVVSAAPVE